MHRDAVNARLRARRGARITAVTCGGAIAEIADYRVVTAGEERTVVGTVDEDQGTGLRGLRERVRATGGVLVVRSARGCGTMIEASWRDPQDETVTICPS